MTSEKPTLRLDDLKADHHFISRYFWGVALAIILASLGLASWSINAIKAQAQQSLIDTLNANLDMTNNGINIWRNERMVDGATWGSSEKLVSAVKKQLVVPRVQEALLSSPALTELDNILKPVISKHFYRGYIVLDPDGIVIASQLKTNIGVKLPVSLEQTDIFARALHGEFMVTRPFISEIPLPDSDGKLVADEPSMLAVTPISDPLGNIIALFCLRIDPADNFLRFTQVGRVGDSGETYAFDKKGKLLTDTRFDEHLLHASLIPAQKRGILNIEIRDPGGDTTQNFVPQIPREQQPLTFMVADAIAGHTGINLEGYRDYRGVMVVGAWTWNQDFQIGIATEIDWDEAYLPYVRSRNIILFAFFAITLLLFAITAIVNKNKEQVLYLVNAFFENQSYLKAIFENVLDGIITIDMHGLIISFNPEAERLFGYSTNEILGKNVSQLMPSPYRDEHDKYIESYLKTGKRKIIGFGREVVGQRKDGTQFHMSLGVSEMRILGKREFIGIIRDVTKIKQAEEISRNKTMSLELLQGVAVAANESNTLEEAMLISIEHTCKIVGWPIGHAYILNSYGETNSVLTPSSLWYLNDSVKYGAFKDISDKTPFAKGIGLPGRVWSNGKPEWITDVTLDNNFPRAHNRPELGVRSGIAFPVFTGNTVGAVLEFFSAEVTCPNESLLSVMSHMGIQLGHLMERKNAEKQLRLAAATFETNDAIVITDPNANIIRVNQAFQKITGYCESEVVGKNPRILKSGRHDEEFYASMWGQLLANGYWEGEVWDRRKSGEIYPKHMSISSVKNSQGIVSEYVSVFKDITEIKKAQEDVHQLAFYDHLTKLPNRRLLFERVLFSISSSARKKLYCAVLFLDMDKFKLLNDTMGHLYGDLMLVEIANRIKSCVRNVDTVARIGGDEFVVLLEDLSDNLKDASQKAALIGEKVRFALSETYQLKEYKYQSSPSIGVCLYLGNDKSVEELLKNADIAMYEAKTKGRNQLCFFDHALQTAVETRMTLESDLRQAISNQQFQLYYQIQMSSDRLALGAEALIRWIHPKRGIISPLHFISIAEESSLILDIGRWVIESACRQLAMWAQNKKTRDLVLAINVSSHQFNSPDFVETVKSSIECHRIDPSRLKLELTENVLLTNIDDVVTKMIILKDLGLMLSLDDFGTGYSSLSYMQQLPLNQIKVDQSFVRNIETDANNLAVVKAIIDLAEIFNCDLIAEGVETEGQLNLLRQNGCMAFQGYLFSKPVPIKQFEELLKTQEHSYV